MRSRFICAAALSLVLPAAVCVAPLSAAAQTSSTDSAPPTPAKLDGSIIVDTRPASLANSIIPIQTIGAGVDAVADGHVQSIYTPSNVKQMLTAGDGPISYRLYTELSVQQWHWNPVGTWSNPQSQSGYFIGSATSKSLALDTYGYLLPHRGGTHDQGNDDGYSRLDDGDPATYWKSNPYLTSAYTKEPDALHPQWILIDLGSLQPVDAVRIDWANPYATQFQVQYYGGAFNAISRPDQVQWTTFPSGTFTDSKGGDATLQVAQSPISVRWVRVLMTASSGTYSDESDTDPRSAMGYAVSEIGVGAVDASKNFTDLVVHQPDRKQTECFCSSTDSWHTAADRCKTEEQPGFDTIFRSGITRGLPSMVPVGVVYDTPEGAVAELQFLHNRGYPLNYVEMGEEADEQWIAPEDYGSLYCQWATAIHARFPNIKIGGPVMASHAFTMSWPDAAGNTDWLGRFYAYLQSHGHAQDLAFYSFEFYPDARGGFDGMGLFESVDAVHQIFDQKRKSKIPDSIPAFLTEYNIDGYSPQQVGLYGAVWHADFLANFLTSGGKGIYYYEYEPLPFGGRGPEMGSFSMFSSGDDNRIRQALSQYFSSRLTNLYWLDPERSNQRHDLYPASSTVPKTLGHDLVTAYAVHRPDGLWSVMLVNKSSADAYQVSVAFQSPDSGKNLAFSGAVRRAQFGPGQYVFHQNGPDGGPQPDGPEAVDTLNAVPNTSYLLPARSITVLTGAVR